jgi:hypothetical protein
MSYGTLCKAWPGTLVDPCLLSDWDSPAPPPPPNLPPHGTTNEAALSTPASPFHPNEAAFKGTA